MWWSEWWLWLAVALLLAIGEVLLPSFVLLGFAIGAAIAGFVFLIGGPLAIWLAGSLPLAILFFAVMSLLSWLGLRRWLGLRKGQVKTFNHDVND